jgi:hypothetical protein
MQAKYGDRAAFYVVYIREAHPTDGWQVAANKRDEILFEQPTSLIERAAVAEMMCSELKINIPCLIDNLDDKVGKDYSAWPDRLYIVGTDGTIAYKGGPGPRGFKPTEAAEALEEYLAGKNKTEMP